MSEDVNKTEFPEGNKQETPKQEATKPETTKQEVPNTDKPKPKRDKKEHKFENDNASTDEFAGDPFLNADVIERGYSKPNTDATAEDINNPIPEPQFERPLLNVEGGGEDGEKTGESESPNEKFKMDNPDLRDAPNSVKKEGAKRLAREVIRAYIKLNEVGRNWVKFDKQKAVIKAAKGKLNLEVLRIELPLDDEGNTIPVISLLDNMNTVADGVIVVSPEFIEEAEPLLIEVFSKHGFGLTPEQQLLLLFGQDILMKVSAIFSIKKGIADILAVATYQITKGGQEDSDLVREKIDEDDDSDSGSDNAGSAPPPRYTPPPRPSGSNRTGRPPKPASERKARKPREQKQKQQTQSAPKQNNTTPPKQGNTVNHKPPQAAYPVHPDIVPDDIQDATVIEYTPNNHNQ